MQTRIRIKVTENNALQLLADYVLWKYGEGDLMKLEDQCTYNLDFDDEDKVYKQILTWLMLERKDPKTGKTSVEEFVEMFVNNNSELAKKILGMRNIITDTFLILENKGNNILFMEDSKRKKFSVQVKSEHSYMYTIGRFVEGRIHPWGDVYKFAGIIKLKKSNEEILKETGLIMPDLVMKWHEKKFKEDAESIVINKGSSLQSILNKLPSEWINALCSRLHIKRVGKKSDKVKKIVTVLLSTRLQVVTNKLPKDALEALELVKQNDGVIRYSELVKKYGGDDFGLWWEKNPPITPIGTLRIHGLLIVGRMLKGERLFKTAMIPKDILQNMNNQIV
ncbi:MAG: hypothetical protein ABJB76_01670 [Candidatus Nitrosocosmicus sp.]